MKKRRPIFLTCLVALMILCPLWVHADMGPKPSVRITFENMDQEQRCYGTLLSKTSSTGPSSVWDGESDYAAYLSGEEEYAIWQAFVEYEDVDGFYFLQEWWECSETQQLNWTYYPPQTFKILLYYPQTDRFVVSGIYERYAFDSYYTVNMAGFEMDSISAQDFTLVAERSYDYTWELLSLACRIVATIGIEVAIALLFGLRQKRVLLLITYTNLVTQVLLNVALNVVNYSQGAFAFLACYVLFELAVCLIEGVWYFIRFSKVSAAPISKARVTAYTLCANGGSLAVGILIARYLPGIF